MVGGVAVEAGILLWDFRMEQFLGQEAFLPPLLYLYHRNQTLSNLPGGQGRACSWGGVRRLDGDSGTDGGARWRLREATAAKQPPLLI